MSDPDYAELERLARAATPGPWKGHEGDAFVEGGEIAICVDGPTGLLATLPTGVFTFTEHEYLTGDPADRVPCPCGHDHDEGLPTVLDLADTFCFLRRHRHAERSNCLPSRREADRVQRALRARRDYRRSAPVRPEEPPEPS